MSLPRTVTHEFVEFIPPEREEGKLYISIPYSTIVHSCLCGCGMKVVTPIKPHKWVLTYDGEHVSLHPSVGNWSFDCQSHYVIKESRVIEAGPMTRGQIDYGRARDAGLSPGRASHPAAPSVTRGPTPAVPLAAVKRHWWEKIWGRKR